MKTKNLQVCCRLHLHTLNKWPSRFSKKPVFIKRRWKTALKHRCSLSMSLLWVVLVVRNLLIHLIFHQDVVWQDSNELWLKIIQLFKSNTVRLSVSLVILRPKWATRFTLVQYFANHSWVFYFVYHNLSIISSIWLD